MKYILILMVLHYSGSGNRPAITTAEFNNKKVCQQAIRLFKQNFLESNVRYNDRENSVRFYKAICVPKGEIQSKENK